MTLDYEIPTEWRSDPREAQAYVAGVNMALSATAARVAKLETVVGAARALSDAGPDDELDWAAIARALEDLDDSPVGVAATADGPGPGPLCAKCGAPIGYCRTVCARDVERVRDAERSVTNGQTPETAGDARGADPPETARAGGNPMNSARKAIR